MRNGAKKVQQGHNAAYKAEYCCECTVIGNSKSNGDMSFLSPAEIMQMQQNQEGKQQLFNQNRFFHQNVS